MTHTVTRLFLAPLLTGLLGGGRHFRRLQTSLTVDRFVSA